MSVVALVCSTGGLEALRRMLPGLPATFPAAVVVLRHCAPSAPDMFPAMLRPHTVLPVAAARDGDDLLPGRILTAPGGFHTLITGHGTIALIAAGPVPPCRPSADLLLTSLALAIGPRATAVVLSGHGSDGATGASAVHRFGGTVIVSDPADAQVVDMPDAVIARGGIVDHVAALDQVPGLLMVAVAPEPGQSSGCQPADC